jgi:hypothetical protein
VVAGHPHRTRAVIGIGGRQALGIGDGEAGVVEAERTGHDALHDLRERSAPRPRDDLSQHVEGQRIVPRRARLEEERDRRDPARILLEGEAGLVEAVGHVGAVVGPVRLLEEWIVETRRMGEELANRNDRLPSARQPRPEVGQPARNWIVQAQAPGLDQR